MKQNTITRRAIALASIALCALACGLTLPLTAEEALPKTAAPAQSALDIYRAWLATRAAHALNAAVICGKDVEEANRIGDLLKHRGITATIIQRVDLPGADVAKFDLFIITTDTHSEWSKPWGTDAEARVITTTHKPVVGIGIGGLCFFGRLDLPVQGGRSASDSSDGVLFSQHAVFQAPHEVPGKENAAVPFYADKVSSKPSHRNAFTSAVVPIGQDVGDMDYALILYQHPGAAYWGFDGAFRSLTDTGKDVFENLTMWTVWASGQKDVAQLGEGITERPDPTRRGERSISITMTRCDGTPAPEMSFIVEVYDPVTEKGWVEFSKGVTDHTGRATITALTDGPTAERYQVMVKGIDSSVLDIELKEKNDPNQRNLTARIPPLVGDTAPTFTTTDINGKKISLADFKGKYVLLDFWASWCVPCRQSNPHLIKLYNTYKTKNFDIIGIADNDSSEDEWKAAVAKDKVGNWHNVLRGYKEVDEEKGKTPNPDDLTDQYGVHYLPTQILIGPDGKIINRGDKIDEMLRSIFDK